MANFPKLPNKKGPRFTGGPKGKGPKGPKPSSPQGGGFWSNVLTTLLVFVVLFSIYTLIVENQEPEEEVSLSEIANSIKEDRVSSLVIEGEEITVTFKDESQALSNKEVGSSVSETLINLGVTEGQLSGIEIRVKSPSGLMVWLVNLAPFIIPILFIVVFIWILSRQVKGAGMQAFTFGQSKARFVDPKDKKQQITFKDVAGVKEAKEELLEVVDFLKNPKKFLKIGARIPKGIILMGPPGTGKTLLARAVAGEAKVPFFSISGSEFVEMFVGVGASRVRDLFKMAKRTAPAIIFVDEIDAVGRTRGGGYGGGNDEREQTLNQILVEMDGFEPNEKVIVMAATNRPDVLDPALLRPGRFDRRVKLDLPDRNDREKILEIHANEKPLSEDVDLRVIAERTPGMSGADLQSLMNEGAILAAREDRKKVSQYDLIRSIEKVMIGPERKSHILSDREKRITAYHEAGHALVASVLPHADPVHKVSIIARGHAGGYTINLPLEEKRLHSRKDFLDELAVMLGGYVTELEVFDDITTGPSNDLQVATNRVRSMVTRYGMSEELGPIAFEDDDGKVIYGKGFKEKDYSEKVGAMIDDEVSSIMKDARKRALGVVTKHRELLDTIANELIEKETIEQDEFEKILIAGGIKPKKKKEED